MLLELGALGALLYLLHLLNLLTRAREVWQLGFCG